MGAQVCKLTTGYYDNHYIKKTKKGLFTTMYNYLKKLLPKSFNDFFTTCSDVHNYHKRNRSNYKHTRNKKVFNNKTIRTTGLILWNSLQDEIKNANSNKHFRKIFKLSLLNSQI